MSTLRLRVGGRTIEIKHADNVLYPDDGITEGDVAQYYALGSRGAHMITRRRAQNYAPTRSRSGARCSSTPRSVRTRLANRERRYVSCLTGSADSTHSSPDYCVASSAALFVTCYGNVGELPIASV